MYTNEGNSFDRLIPVASIALGIGSRVIDTSGHRWVGNVAALWFLTAFLMGRRQESAKRGASAGVISLAIATVVYYAWRLGIDGTISAHYLRTIGAFWSLAAVGVGAAAGWAGWRSRGIVAYWGVTAGAFLGEAAAVALLSQRTVQIAAEVAAGGLLIWRGRPRMTHAVGLAVAAGGLVFLAALIYRVALR